MCDYFGMSTLGFRTRGEEWDLLHPGVKPEENLTPSGLNSCNDD